MFTCPSCWVLSSETRPHSYHCFCISSVTELTKVMASKRSIANIEKLTCPWRERKGLRNPWNAPTAVTSALHSLGINPCESCFKHTQTCLSVLWVKGDNTNNSTITFIFRELRVTWCGGHPFLGYFPKNKHNDSPSPCNPPKVGLNPNENYSYNLKQAQTMGSRFIVAQGRSPKSYTLVLQLSLGV